MEVYSNLTIIDLISYKESNSFILADKLKSFLNKLIINLYFKKFTPGRIPSSKRVRYYY